MAPLSCRRIYYLFFYVFVSELRFCLASKVYVVYMGSATNENPEEIYIQNHKMLTEIHQGSTIQAKASHVYSYMHGFKGFAAKLTEEQAMTVARMPGVVSVFQNTKRKLHTTHSWDFMGLPTGEAMQITGQSTKNQENVIIGFIDTGIWPESASFSDHGMPPVPSKWKGHCQAGQGFNASSCNRKLIGARYYESGFQVEEDSVNKFSSPRDSNGHGTHTASTAAGRYVLNAHYNGLGKGVARGGAPMARIAVYKACWDSGCYDADILAAFDDAIKDGVHILSLSLGPQSPQGDYFRDPVSIGSFHAARQGVILVSSSGNEGFQGSATNLAPWMTTVGATSTDRDFTSDIFLGDGRKYRGESLSIFKLSNFTSIISAFKANAGDFTPYISSYCINGTLNSTKTRGKIVVCLHTGSPSETKLEKSQVVKEVGGVGMILIDDVDKDMGIPFVIPSAIVGTKTGEKILSYANHTRKPTARFSAVKTVIGSQPAPRITSFSSKGPNSLTPEILKPDVSAPGLNILAAWSPANNKLNFNILSGTSMACPHVTGIAALVKAVYPHWSPSAIKSAIMTTATTLSKSGRPITADPDGRKGTPFDYGSGFVDLLKVLNPGLVYETQPGDYEAFLCSIGYDEKLLRLITRDNSTCRHTFRSASDLNYPSITVPDLRDSYSVTRTVTNVGQPRSVYRVVVSAPKGISVTVVPDHLIFNSYGQKMKYSVNFIVTAPSKGYVFGSLQWRNRDVAVTSPLVVRVRSTNMSFSR